VSVKYRIRPRVPATEIIKGLRRGLWESVLDWDLDKIEADVQMRLIDNPKLEKPVKEILDEIRTVRDCRDTDTDRAISSALYVGIMFTAFISKMAIPVSTGPKVKKDGAPETIRRIKNWDKIAPRKLLKLLKKRMPERDDESLTRAIRNERSKLKK